MIDEKEGACKFLINLGLPGNQCKDGSLSPAGGGRMIESRKYASGGGQKFVASGSTPN